MKAGLGIIRKNNFFYTDQGSFVGLTGYIIDRECTLHQNVSPRPCSDACPYNRRHDWDKGESFSDLEEIAKDLVPEKQINQTDDFLRREVIAKTDNHLDLEDTNVLRINARRAIKNARMV